jgi:2-keto-4-pentenoate hydratase/2-oxohepta-3-ene-1,7-dioic acid hydratase in catechol pathway
MKLVAFQREGRRSIGIVRENGIVDVTKRVPSLTTLVDVLRGGGLAALEAIAESQADCTLDEVELLKPIERPDKILCVGVNYRDRPGEYRDGAEAPRYPSLFVRFPDSLVPHRADLIRPRESREFDYEGELAVVIGRSGRRIAEAHARDCIAGFTVANDGSVRDWLRHGKFNVTQGKNFDRSGSIGPWIVTTDAMPAGPLRVRTRVNGEERQNDTTDRLLFPFDYLISYLSTFTTLEPGDMILTGTPNGAGARFNPPKWLIPSDVVEVDVSGIGVLSNAVADEQV